MRLLEVRESDHNRQKLVLLQTLIGELRDSILASDFHGTVSLVLTIRNGTIQSIEQNVKQTFR